jgi:hypothetical protein
MNNLQKEEIKEINLEINEIPQKEVSKFQVSLNLSKSDYINYDQLQLILNSRILPEWINSVEKLATALIYAKELKMPPLTALKNMYIVKGIPTINVNLMTAIIRANGHYFKIVKEWAIIENENGKDAYCEVHAYRKNELDENNKLIVHVVRFSWNEAKLMGLTEKENWKKMPQAMLKARCLAKMARDVYSDICNGFYTPEEIDPNINISDFEVV